MYDLIGHVHGELDALERLLRKLGYRQDAGVWRHPDRQAVFVGDLIDRGDQSRQVVATARAMVAAGSAHCIMGNHEFNAIGFHTPDPRGGGYLRPRSDKNHRQHAATLESYRGHAAQLADDVAWFQGLPFWLALDGVRVVHAAWSPEAMAVVEKSGVRERMDWPTAFPEVFDESGPLGAALSEVLKGVEWALPDSVSFRDKDGNHRTEARVTWWKVAPVLRLLVVGESTAAGVGATDQARGLARWTAETVAALSGRAVAWRVLGRNGATALAAGSDPGGGRLAAALRAGAGGAGLCTADAAVSGDSFSHAPGAWPASPSSGRGGQGLGGCHARCGLCAPAGRWGRAPGSAVRRGRLSSFGGRLSALGRSAWA